MRERKFDCTLQTAGGQNNLTESSTKRLSSARNSNFTKILPSIGNEYLQVYTCCRTADTAQLAGLKIDNKLQSVPIYFISLSDKKCT